MTYVGRISGLLLTTTLLVLFSVPTILAAPPTPEAKRMWIEQGVWNRKVDNWQQFKAAGGCAPSIHPIVNTAKLRTNRAQGIQVVDTISVILILVDFSDNPWQTGTAVTTTMFDSILFSDRDTDPAHMPYGSMHDFYLEN
ncbi:MAG: hypothetical protein ACREBV_07470, partial [Candidatus Zixiibacteriota bacterium]